MIIGLRINVQAEIERPQLYLIARCPSSEAQIVYNETRIEDLLELKKKLKNEKEIEINDVMRFFKGMKIYFQ